MRLLGAILAGGQSRRFGADKALAPLAGRPLIEHVRRALAGQTGAVVLCGRAGGLADRPGPGLGPLGGLAAALHHGRAHGFDAVLSAPCDMPGLPADLAARLGGPAFLAEAPVVGLWPCRLADALEAHLAAGGDRSIRRWAAAAGVAERRLGLALANVNTAEDLADLAGRGEPAASS